MRFHSISTRWYTEVDDLAKLGYNMLLIPEYNDPALNIILTFCDISILINLKCS